MSLPGEVGAGPTAVADITAQINEAAAAAITPKVAAGAAAEAAEQAAAEIASYSQTGISDRTYVIAPLKILHISAPKNACTSLRWLIAELANEDPAQFRPGLTPAVSTEDAIHLRRRFRHTPRLTDIDPGLLSSIHPDNGWFVFGVVRDPRSRLFSAWQDKLLLRSARFRNFANAEWYPRAVETKDDVVREFARFVDAMYNNRDLVIARDGHFASQTGLLRPDVYPYSRIYDVGEMQVLLDDLTAHLERQGMHRTLALRRTNDTPLRANSAVFAGNVRFLIEELYAADFEKFGHLWDFERIERVPEWSASALQEMRSRVLLHERIGELLTIGRAERQRAATAERQLATTAGQLRRAERQIERLQDRLDAVRRRADDTAGQLARLEEARMSRRAGRVARAVVRRARRTRAR